MNEWKQGEDKNGRKDPYWQWKGRYRICKVFMPDTWYLLWVQDEGWQYVTKSQNLDELKGIAK